jgi:alkylation response protein AidB-like acyl-CoA dehydrogenase
MDFSLTPAQRKWVERAESLVPVFRERARRYDESAAFPAENMQALREQGFFALGIPREYGGADLGENSSGFVQHLVVEKISEGCSSTGWNLMIQWVNCQVVCQLSSGAIREQVLTDVARNGALIGSLGSEVNAQDMKNAAGAADQLKIDAAFRPVPDGFLANGKKHFCTLAPEADYLLLWALAPGTSGNDEGLTISVLPRSTPGITFNSAGWNECVGLRATVSWSAELKDVFVSWANVLGEPGDFVQKDPYTFDLGHIAHLLGTAQGLLDGIVDFVRGRTDLQEDQVYTYWITEMHGSLQSSRASFWYANWLWEQKRFNECLLASYNALHSARATALRIADQAFDICGTRALFKFMPFERGWRDIRTASLHTRDTQLARLQLQAILADGKMFSKQKYGKKLARRKTWKDLGLAVAVDA